MKMVDVSAKAVTTRTAEAQAFVEMKPGHTATADELIEWCRARLARYKCPRHIVFAEIPKTSTGKVQKFALRERAKLIEAEKA